MRYWLLAGGAFLVALLVSWTPVATSIDNSAYDWMCRLYPVFRPNPQSVIVAIDETTLQQRGGMRALRPLLAETLNRIADAQPAAVAVDFTLADASDPKEDAVLAQAMARISNLVLATDIAQDGSGWQDPLPAFRTAAKALGHVHADPDPVCRDIPLSKAAGRVRRWALALEGLHPGTVPLESSGVIDWDGRLIPNDNLRIAFSQELPRQSANALDPAALRGKTVFVGATPLTAARDRLMTPLGRMMPGVEIHAQLFETLREGKFRNDLPPSFVVGIMLALAVAIAGAIRWRSYAGGAAVLIVALALPFAAFKSDTVLPAFSLAMAAFLPGLTAATYQYRATKKNLLRAEADRSRYQQAIHWVTHEMRSPLTAIQGSSELMTRYNLPTEKQKQIADMINSESKRLAQMIQTFLDVERLSSGQVELKRAPFSLSSVVRSCISRAEALAERKQQSLITGPQEEAIIEGDRELMEFALYNLVTNAIKYSPEGTEVRLSLRRENSLLRVAVSDQGMGIDEKDLDRLGTRFFRTKRAEESGIQGTGIGLSIVREIVARHGGKLEVSSRVGAGSCFTMVMPAPIPAEVRAQS